MFGLENDQDILERTIERVPDWGKNMLLMGYRGSHAHGTYIPSTDPNSIDDIDIFAVSIQPINFYIGLDGLGMKTKSVFSTPGEELDIEMFDFRKFIYLLNKGNPNVHQWLWTHKHLFVSPYGQILLDRKEGFLSRKMFDSFGGYAVQQLKRMTKWKEGPSKEGYMGKKRFEIAQEHGYDIKNAAHCIRLLYCGIILAMENQLVIRLPDPALNTVMEIKQGKWLLDDVVKLAHDLDAEFRAVAKANTTLSDDYQALRKWSNDTLALILRKQVEGVSFKWPGLVHKEMIDE
jgi:predicted nucleotidyltransferase